MELINLSPFGSTMADVAVKYDGWGRLVSATGQFGYEYDALGRVIQRTGDGSLVELTPGEPSGSLPVGSFFDGDKVIEERNAAGDVVRRYVWSPDGTMILRDRPAALTSATGERAYVLSDAEGNTTAVAEQNGTVLERYAYELDGRPRALNADWTYTTQSAPQTISVSKIGFEHLWHGLRWNSLGGDFVSGSYGLYEVSGGGWYDAQNGRTMQPNPLLASMGQNAYGLQTILTSMEGWHEDVGVGEGMIPVWGSGKQAYYNFGRGEWVQGLANTYLAATDAVGVGLLAKAAGKMAVQQIGRAVTSEAMQGLARNSTAYVRGFAQGLSHVSATPALGSFYSGAYNIVQRAHRTGLRSAAVEARLSRAVVSATDYGQEAVLAARRTLQRAGYTSYGEFAGVGKYRNNGFDDIFIKQVPDESILDIIVTESKWTSIGRIPSLSMTGVGPQMGSRWVNRTIRRMMGDSDIATKFVGRTLFDYVKSNGELSRKINVFDAVTGHNRWHQITLPD